MTFNIITKTKAYIIYSSPKVIRYSNTLLMQPSQTVLQSSKNLAKSLKEKTQKGAHPVAKM